MTSGASFERGGAGQQAEYARQLAWEQAVADENWKLAQAYQTGEIPVIAEPTVQAPAFDPGVKTVGRLDIGAAVLGADGTVEYYDF